MVRSYVPTLQTWRWMLGMPRVDAHIMGELRDALRGESALLRFTLFLAYIGTSLVSCIGPFLAISRLAFGPGYLELRLSGVGILLPFLFFLVASTLLGFGVGTIGVAWLSRRFKLLSEPALEYFLRRGPL